MEISISEFQAKCLSLIDDISQSDDDEIVITKSGRPQAVLLPYCKRQKPSLFGMGKDSVKYTDDIIKSNDRPWNAEQ